MPPPVMSPPSMKTLCDNAGSSFFHVTASPPLMVTFAGETEPPAAMVMILLAASARAGSNTNKTTIAVRRARRTAEIQALIVIGRVSRRWHWLHDRRCGPARCGLLPLGGHRLRPAVG